jgi:hypothetical protein
MTILNPLNVKNSNRNLAYTINDLGELLSREHNGFYRQIIIDTFKKTPNNIKEQEEQEFLYKLYYDILDKFKEIKFGDNNTD